MRLLPQVFTVLTLLCAGACGGGGGAAPPAVHFVDLSITRLPLDHDFGQDAALGDVDGDGDLDVFVPTFKGPNRLLVNDGEGNFRDEGDLRLPLDGDASVHAALVDLDADGDPDLIVANEGTNRLYRNDGPARPGHFTEVPLPGDDGVTESVAVGDVDGDGDVDLVFGNLGIGVGGQQNTLLLNDGSGSFSDATTTRTPPTADPTYQALLLDVDGDGDLDVFAANNGAPNRLLLNDGSGHFVEAPKGRLPVDTDDCTAATFGDVDGDGDLDLVTLSFDAAPNRLLLNDGFGTFTQASAGALPPDAGLSNYDADLGDVDGDGDLDLMVVGILTRLYLNDGSGVFEAGSARVPLDWMFGTYDVDLGDLDGDGDLDAYVTNNGDDADRLYMNGAAPPSGVHAFHIRANHGSTAGRSSVTVTGQGLEAVTDVLLGGVPLEGLLVVNPSTLRGTTGAAPAGRVAMTLQTEAGSVTFPAAYAYEDIPSGSLFSDATARLPSDADVSSDVLAGDVDGDGDPDLLFVNDGAPHRLYLLQAATGSYVDATASHLPATNTAENNTGQAGALVDLDRDGDLDLIIANDGFETAGGPGKPNRLYRNDGTGVFSDITADALPADGDHANGLVAADFDGDGYVDLFFANDGRNALYRNRGVAAPGTFEDVSASGIPGTAVFSRAAAALDVEPDGDLDLVIGNKDERNHLWLNDGTGTFGDATAARLPDELAGGGSNDTSSVAVLDADGDGDADILLSRNFVGAALLYLNDGSGVFTQDAAFQDPDPGRRLYGSVGGTIADFTGDGHLDLLFAFWIMTPTVRILPGDGAGSFTLDEGLIATGSAQFTAACALDYDGDGDLDLAVSASGQNLLFENLTPR